MIGNVNHKPNDESSLSASACSTKFSICYLKHNRWYEDHFAFDTEDAARNRSATVKDETMCDKLKLVIRVNTEVIVNL